MVFDRKAYSKEYYLENKKKLNTQGRKWKKKNKERVKISNKEWKKKNKEKVKISDKKERGKPGRKEYMKTYHQQSKMKSYKKEYRTDSKNKRRANKIARKRNKNDSNFHIQCLISSAFVIAMNRFSDTGKIRSMKRYGIDMKAIIEHLGPKPKGKYDVDHIIPKSWFNHDNPNEVKWCWAHENLQWLRHDINIWKSNRFILKLSLKEQERWKK